MTAGRSEPQFWSGLQAMASGIGLRPDWAWAFGPAHPLIEPFLVPTTEVAESYPCAAQPPCECRHALRDLGHELAAVCTCGGSECETFFVPPENAIAWRIDLERFDHALAMALHLEQVDPGPWQSTALRDLGKTGPLRVPVRYSNARPGILLNELIARQAMDPHTPFVLLVPSERSLDAEAKHLLASSPVVQLPVLIEFEADGGMQPTPKAGDILQQAAKDAAGRQPGLSIIDGVRHELACFEEKLARVQAQSPPLTEEVAHQLFTVIRELEPAGQARKAPVLKVFRLYCIEGLTPEQVAQRCGCSRSLIVLRLQQMERKLGRHPSELRAYSSQFEQIEDALSDPRARRIRRKGALYGDESFEAE